MTELITEAVAYGDRSRQLMQVPPHELRNYYANLVRMAFIAGANRVNIRSQCRDEPNVTDHGEIKVLADLFVKDKGLVP